LKVLIAEDDATSRLILQTLLGQWQYEVVSTADGEQAWEALRGAAPPELAILDWQMPGLEGPEICRRLRARADGAAVYTILLTARNAPEDIVAGLQAGADDYLAKPFHKDELRARVQVGKRTIDLQASQARYLQEIETTLLHIQRSFLIGTAPSDLQGASVAATLAPYSRVSGDFYDFHCHGPGCFDVLLGDVMGKGMRAALMGAAAVDGFVRNLARTGGGDHGGACADPETVVRGVADGMLEQLRHLDSFITLCYGRFDMMRHTFTFVDCGHTRPLHLCARSGACVAHAGHNMPMGVMEDEPVRQVNVSFEPGDVFLLYSDGVTEAMNPAREMFGEERLASLLQAGRDLAPRDLVQAVTEEVERFTAGCGPHDDVTCIAVRIA
jgi:phosphoserine phosphatase RsbU/P